MIENERYGFLRGSITVYKMVNETDNTVTIIGGGYRKPTKVRKGNFKEFPKTLYKHIESAPVILTDTE